MEEVIVARLNPTELKQEVYIMSSSVEKIPLVQKCNINELPSVIAMSAAKYNISNIKIAGPKAYSEGVRAQVVEKINTCFDNKNEFTIELIKTKKEIKKL